MNGSNGVSSVLVPAVVLLGLAVALFALLGGPRSLGLQADAAPDWHGHSAPPPIDRQVHAHVETATFALG